MPILLQNIDFETSTQKKIVAFSQIGIDLNGHNANKKRHEERYLRSYSSDVLIPPPLEKKYDSES